jgi:hypothetical protein
MVYFRIPLYQELRDHILEVLMLPEKWRAQSRLALATILLSFWRVTWNWSSASSTEMGEPKCVVGGPSQVEGGLDLNREPRACSRFELRCLHVFNRGLDHCIVEGSDGEV